MLEIDEDKILNAIKWFRINDEIIENYRKYRKMAKYKPGSNMDRAYTAVATEVLNQLSYDLTREAKWGRLEICVAREDEIEDIFQKFESGRAGVILVGDPGAGKNTIVGGIAQAMVREDVPNILKDKRLVELDVARLVSGAARAKRSRGFLSSWMKSAVREYSLVYQNIENIVGIQAGVGEPGCVESWFPLWKGSFIASLPTTISNYSKYIENKPIGELMARIEIREPEKNRAIRCLKANRIFRK